MTSPNHKEQLFVTVIRKFAEAMQMSIPDAYDYLEQFGGISFLEKCYEAEHQQSMSTILNDITEVCRNNGGLR